MSKKNFFPRGSNFLRGIKLFPRTDMYQSLGTPKKGVAFRLADSFIEGLKERSGAGSVTSFSVIPSLTLVDSPLTLPLSECRSCLQGIPGPRYFPSLAECRTAPLRFLGQGGKRELAKRKSLRSELWRFWVFIRKTEALIS